jgi:hypothetical protein
MTRMCRQVCQVLQNEEGANGEPEVVPGVERQWGSALLVSDLSVF